MRRVVARVAALLVPLAAAVAAGAAAGESGTDALSSGSRAPNTGISIGVAPFETVGGSAAPLDVAARLAEALAARGVERVVGPDALGATATAEPAAEIVRGWAADAEVGGIAVGRVTRLGRRLNVTVRLRDGASGDVLGTYVAEADRIELLPPEIDRLADQLAGARPALGAPPATAGGAAGAGAAVAASPPGASKAPGPLGLGLGLQDDGGDAGPIDISAAETEFLLDEGRTIFRGDVRVKQGDVTLTCDRLEALIDSETDQPTEVTCTGSVRIQQLDKVVSCERATYSGAQQRVLCRENARAEIGEHRAAGDEIEFRLDTNRVFVRSRSGRARVQLRGGGGSQ